MSRYVVVVTREGLFGPDSIAVVGAYRSKARAEKRAAAIRRLANTYEDPEGVTGPDNALDVTVEPLLKGASAATLVLDVLYGSVEANA